MRRSLAVLASFGLTTSLAVLAPPASANSDDESPTVKDTAVLKGGKVIGRDDIKVRFTLTCPQGDRWAASMVTLTVGSGAPDDIVSRSEASGRCQGKPQKMKIRLATQPIDGTLYPAPENCSAEYGVRFTGPDWEVAFDRSGADGRPDGPGPQLCLR